jgi:hypothetical protein
MAARAHIPFITAFNAAVRPTNNLSQMASNADLKASMLAWFNRSYKIGYEFPWQSDGMWEDARVWAEITPTAGVIDPSIFGDARAYSLYTQDPRETRLAQSVQAFHDASGILVSDELQTVWASWVPRRFHFDTTEWVTATAYVVGNVRTLASSGECYRCIVAHTSGSVTRPFTGVNCVVNWRSVRRGYDPAANLTTAPTDSVHLNDWGDQRLTEITARLMLAGLMGKNSTALRQRFP